MKHRFLILSLAFVVVLSFLGISARTALAFGNVKYYFTCSRVFVTVTGGTPGKTYDVGVWLGSGESGSPLVGFPTGIVGADGTTSYSASFPALPAGTQIYADTITNDPPGGFALKATGPCSGGAVFWEPGDDRLNRDPGQPAALYCRSGNVQVWAVDPSSSRGTLALIVTKLEITNVKNSKPAQNTLIKASVNGKLKLFYLPASDELSFITTYLNSDKPYFFVWKGCS